MEYFWKKKTVLSFLAAGLIVAIHNSATMQFTVPTDGFSGVADFLHKFFAYGLGGVAVPFFFFVSGIALFRNYRPSLYKEKMRSRFRSLVIPYLIWNMVGILFAILYTWTPLSRIVSGRELFEPTISNVLGGIFLHKYNFHFWFMFDLIVYVVLTPAIDIMTRKKWSSGILLVLLLILPAIKGEFLTINLSFTVFYALGCVVGRHYLGEVKVARPKAVSGACGVVAIAVLVVRMLDIYGVVKITTVVAQGLLLLLLLALFVAADLWVRKAKPRKIYEEFFPVYVLHPYIISVIVKVFHLLAPENSAILLLAEVAGTVITIVVAVWVVRVWHKKWPRFYGISFLGRAQESRRP